MIECFKFSNCNQIPNCVACIGFFDGVHLGHQALLKKTIQIAKNHNLPSLVITFNPDPEEIIYKHKVSSILSLQSRINKFDEFGIDYCLVLDFNEELMLIKPESFINDYLKKISIEHLVCGFDFSFGYKGSGNYCDLQKSFNTTVVDKVEYNNLKISSTYIKELLNAGNIELANKLLGYQYFIDPSEKIELALKNGTYLLNNGETIIIPLNKHQKDILIIKKYEG